MGRDHLGDDQRTSATRGRDRTRPVSFGCGGSSSARTTASASTDWRGFAAWVAERAAAGKFSGVVLIARDGKPVVKQANGFADRRRRIPNNVETRFNIGSAGKMFTAVAIAQLVEAGKLSFDDPIAKYLSAFRPEIASEITIGRLLTQRRGWVTCSCAGIRVHPRSSTSMSCSQ